MTSLAKLRESMTDFLTDRGLRALSAWPKTERTAKTAPLILVRLGQVEAGPAGFHRYLGEAFDQTAQAWTERYGGAVKVTYVLTLYSPEDWGEEGCRDLLEQVAALFPGSGPGGLPVEGWTMGETAFHRESGMYRGELRVRCRGFLTEEVGTDGIFRDFDVKGEVTV